MKKNIFFVIQLLVVATALFAEKSLDDAILEASEYIQNNCNEKSKLVIYAFDIDISSVSPKGSKKMASEISERLEESLTNKNIVAVTRDPDKMKQIDKILEQQHNSEYFDPGEIISLGKKMPENIAIFGRFDEYGGAYRLRVWVLDLITGTEKIQTFKGISYSKEIDEPLGIASSYKKVGLGFGAEINKNSLDSVAPAGSISFDYNVFRTKTSIGLKMFASFDMNEKNNNLIILEPLASLRFYLVSHAGVPGTGIFLEGLGGVSIYLVESDTDFAANCGAGFGYRAAFQNLYIEPEIRFGYPYMFGAGLSAGFRF